MADTGNNRVLSLAAGATQPVVRARIASPGSIAVDATGNIFFLSQGSLYQVSGSAQPKKIGSFPGALFVAYGPAAGENDTIYVLSAQASPAFAAETADAAVPRYTVSAYAYHGAAGTLATRRSFQTTDTIQDFGVDAKGNYIFASVSEAASSQPHTHLFEISTAGDNLALTAPIAGKNIRLALDYNRNIYYGDAQGIYELMKDSVDFGTVSQEGGQGSPTTLVLNFALPTSVAVARTSYVVDGASSSDFEDGFPFDANCSAGSGICSVPVSYLPSDLGITAATMSLLDANGKVLVQVPLHGVGMYPIHELFTENEVATPDMPTSGGIRQPAGICNTTSLGPMITDVSLGSVFTAYSNEFSATGVGKAQTVAHLPAGNTYVTQAGKAGVLAIHPDHSFSRVATRLATEPNGVGIDGAGNLYISDRGSVFRVGTDGVEAELASPDTDGGYDSVQSIAVDPAGNTYAWFGAGGPAGKGGLLKITPNGAVTAVNSDAASAAELALDTGGGLYFSDSVNKSLETLRTDGTWMTLLTGLKKPLGVTALYGPLLVDQGAAQLLTPTLPQSSFDFGSVPVGTTVTKTFTVFAMGNAETSGELFFGGFDSAFSSGGSYKVEAGGSQTVTISFTPTYPGPHSTDLYDESNDYFSEQPIVQQYSVTGLGTEPFFRSRK